MSLFGLRNHTNALKRLVLISEVLISEETSLIWESGSRSDFLPLFLVGKIESEISSLQFSVFSLIKGMQWIRTEIVSLSKVGCFGKFFIMEVVPVILGFPKGSDL